MVEFVGGNDDEIFGGSENNDIAYGNGGNDTLSGNGGRDWLIGGEGADLLNGGAGDDFLVSHAANDMFFHYAYYDGESHDTGTERDTLIGGSGENHYAAGYGDTIVGGSGFDWLWLNLSGATSGVTADFRQQYEGGSNSIGGGTISGLEAVPWLMGSNFDDYLAPITGDYSPSSVVYGNGGNDTIIVDYRSSYVSGGTGDDTIEAWGSQYGPIVHGDEGNDVLNMGYDGAQAYGDAGDDEIAAGSGGAWGGAGDDIIRARNPSWGEGFLRGEEGDDILIGGDTASHLIGGSGSDMLYGNDGDDYLWSAEYGPVYNEQPFPDRGTEQDSLFGGNGDDILSIGYGDSADGGAGTDRLIVSLAGAPGGVYLDMGALFAGTQSLPGGGIVTGMEIVWQIWGSDQADHLILIAQDFQAQVDAGGGNDVIEWGNSSVVVNGDDGDDLFISGNAADQINGGDGVDTVDYRKASYGVTVTLANGVGGQGDSLQRIENVTGSAFADSLSGNAGNNLLDGGAGADRLIGGAGNDTYVVDTVLDDVVETEGQGFDTIYSFVSYSLVGRDVETLILSGRGNLTATGNAKANTLFGYDDANMLIGGGGADLLIGGKGDDTYIVDGVGTRVVEAAGEGKDIVRTSVDLNLSGQSIEIVEMLGTARSLVGGNADGTIMGNDVANLIVAGAGRDRVYGGNGDDRIDGGAGNDILSGGAGNDSVSYESATARVVVSLAAQGGFQNTKGAGFDSLSGFENMRGSAFDDRLTGDDGANIISGLAGADVMIGLGGDDQYFVDNAGDKVVEKAGGGYDTVHASVDYALALNVEALVLLGRANIDATGNALDNLLVGNSGNNRLNGGLGADRMVGGAGNDIYYVNDAGDQVVELAGEGQDLVISSLSFDLIGKNVEDLRLVGSADLAAGGDGVANVIVGNAGNNIILGRGGADVLTGGAGRDYFFFDTALGADNIDMITDFVAGGDVIMLDRDIFTTIGSPGGLAAGLFAIGPNAAEADDRILYNSATGGLFYDADGNGAGAAVQFARLSAGLALTHADFVVVA